MRLMRWGYATFGLGLLLVIVAIGLIGSALTLHPREARNAKQIPSDGSPTTIRFEEEHVYAFIAEDDQVTCAVEGPQQGPIEVTASTAVGPAKPEQLEFHVDQSGNYEVSCIAHSAVTVEISDVDPGAQRSFSLYLASQPFLALSIPFLLGGAVVLARARRRRARELTPRLPSHPEPQWEMAVGGTAPPQAAVPVPMTPGMHTPTYPRSVYGSVPYPGPAPQAPPAAQAVPPSPPANPPATPPAQHPYAPLG